MKQNNKIKKQLKQWNMENEFPKKFVIERTGKANFEFTGYHVGHSENSDNDAHPDFSGSPGRKEAYDLYLSLSGKYIATISSYTRWMKEKDTFEAEKFDDINEISSFFEYNSLAKNLYADIDIEFNEMV